MNMPIVNEPINFGAPAPPLDLTNSLASLNGAQINEMLLLINALSCLKVGDIAQNGLLEQQQQPQQQQHTCGSNGTIDCSASTIAAHSSGCTKKYQKSPVPPDYMCHLCFSKEHFIRDCPQVNGCFLVSPFLNLIRW